MVFYCFFKGSRLAAFLLVCGAVPTQAGGHSHGALRSVSGAESFVLALEFKHSLRVCNAYPHTDALNVFRGKNETLTSEAIPYNACEEFASMLQSGDKLEVKVGDAITGTFAVTELPNNDAVMLLVVKRHGNLGTSVAFESHIFANLRNAQVAVMDAYVGKAQGVPHIMDMKAKAETKTRNEELRYDSVVAINPGVYKVALEGQDGKTEAQSELVALEHESYVILRTGFESETERSYPQELVVFPKSDSSKLLSSRAESAKLLKLTSALVLACICW